MRSRLYCNMCAERLSVSRSVLGGRSYYSRRNYDASNNSNTRSLYNIASIWRGAHRKRILSRSNGRSQVKHVGINVQYARFIKDYFTTLINLTWSLTFLIFIFVYLLSWLFFACVWFLVIAVHGHFDNSCVQTVQGFGGAFVYSVVTQSTIGYGDEFLHSECTSGTIVLLLQTLVGQMINSVMLGLVFAKVTRPRKRRETIIFSNVAVIYEKQGRKVLEVQIGDPRYDAVVQCHVRLQMYWNKLVDRETDQRVLHTYDLDVGYSTGHDRLFLLTPVVITHVIDESSPLHEITSASLQRNEIEIVLILEGQVEATGMTVQALTSYTNDEIVFDRKFVNTTYRRNGGWEVDFSKLSKTVSSYSSISPSDYNFLTSTIQTFS